VLHTFYKSFGCFWLCCICSCVKKTKDKTVSKYVKCIFIGYCEKIEGYLYNLISQYVIISRDVIFGESINFNKETIQI
jgi:hypothetical protein